MAESPSASEWRRPHPLTLVMELVGSLPSLVAGLIFVQVRLDDTGSLADLGELLVVVGSLGSAVGRWYSTRYMLNDESLVYRRGMIWRHRQVMPRSNIQNVSTKASLMARVGSVTELQVSDASESGDIRLRFVSNHEAERLTSLLRQSGSGSGPPLVAPNLSEPDEQPNDPGNGESDLPPAYQPPSTQPVVIQSPPIVAPPLSAIVRAELTSPTMVGAFATAGGAALVVVTAFTTPAHESLAGVVENIPGRWWLPLAAIGVGPVIGGLAHTATRILALGGFRVVAEPDRIRISAGLITETKVAARRERVQQIIAVRSLLHRFQGIEQVRFQTADVALLGGIANSYLSPAGHTNHWRTLATEMLGDLQLAEADLAPVSNLTIRRTMVRFILGATVLAPLARYSPLVLGVVAALLMGGWLYSRARYRILGWAVSCDQILVRSGVIDQHLRLVPLDKVQSVRLRQSWFQRRLGLATIVLSTAGYQGGGIAAVSDLPVPQARQLHDTLSRRSATTPLSATI